jgi:ribosomal protein L40E
LVNTNKKAPFITASGIIIIICGWLLVISVFLPWLVAVPAVAARFASSSGSALNISSVLALAGIAGGLLAIGFAFLPAKGAKKILTILLGIIVLGVLVLYLVNGTYPLISSIRLGIAGIGVGCIIYTIAGLVLVITGLTISTGKKPAVTPAAVPAAVAAAPKGNVSPRYQASPPPVIRPAPAAPPSPINVCRACGAAVPAGAAFCRQCGTAISAPAVAPSAAPGAVTYCTRCGAVNPAGSGFCKSCGAALAAPAVAAQPAPPLYCSRCGTPATGGNAYCTRCGSPLPH